MSKYIDREALLEWIEAVDSCLADGTVTASTLYAQIITDIKQFPIIDAVEVVRCKDCKHYNHLYECCKNSSGIRFVKLNSYCSHGERDTIMGEKRTH